MAQSIVTDHRHEGEMKESPFTRLNALLCQAAAAAGEAAVSLGCDGQQVALNAMGTVTALAAALAVHHPEYMRAIYVSMPEGMLAAARFNADEIINFAPIDIVSEPEEPGLGS